MGFFSNFKKTYKKVSKVTKALQPKPVKTEQQQVRETIYEVMDYDDFYYKYENQIDKWDERIHDAVDYRNDNPEKTVKSFEKALKLYDDFVQFCISKDEKLGKEYIEHEGYKIKEDIQNDYDDYMKNEYEQELKYYQETQEEKARIKKIKAKYKKIIKTSGKISQVDLKKELSEEELECYNSIMRELQDSGQISKLKEGSKVYFEINN